MLTDAPLGRPVTDIVTLPVLPVRAMSPVMLSAPDSGNTSGAALESDMERLPP